MVGEYIERNFTYSICRTWSASRSGGQGITKDLWYIDNITTGAIFDLKFNMRDIPDKLLMEYPEGNLVLDTGMQNLNLDGVISLPIYFH